MLASAGAVFAGCTTPTVDPDIDGVYVYDFKATLRTVDGKSATAATACGSVTDCYRVKAGRSLKGVWVACDCGSQTDMNVFITSSTSKGKYGWADHAEFDILNFFGKGQSNASTAQGYIPALVYGDVWKVEAADVFTARIFTLSLAGFGSANPKTGILQSLNGYLVGKADAALCTSNCTVPQFAITYLPCTMAQSGSNVKDEEEPGQDDVVYGTWAIKLNKKATKWASDPENDAGSDGSVVASKIFPQTTWLAP